MAKKKFQVCVKETLMRVINVEASSEEEAIRKVKDSYYDEEIVLMPEDHVGTDFSIFKGGF